jgi:hypothetical protein
VESFAEKDRNHVAKTHAIHTRLDVDSTKYRTQRFLDFRSTYKSQTPLWRSRDGFVLRPDQKTSIVNTKTREKRLLGTNIYSPDT